MQQHLDVGGAGRPVHGHDREQHQHRAGERVEEELEGGIDPPLAAPDADDEEHRDQHALEEHVEQEEIERAEHADHQRLEHEERDHVFLHARLDRDASDARMQIGIRKVDSSTNSIEMPSTPSCRG